MNIPVINATYDNIHDNQIEWYKETVNELNERNEAVFATLNAAKATEYASLYPCVKTSLFFHIPLEEYAIAWNELTSEDHENPGEGKLYYGTQGEKVCCSETEDGMFEAALETGSTDSMFCGHDHVNTYSVDYKGVRLTYGMSIDYVAYIGISKKGAQRGCTMITYDGPDFDCVAENYYQDKYETLYEKESDVEL